MHVIPHPFRGDTYLLDTVRQIMEGAEVFVETGAFYGITTAFMAKEYPGVQCYSCEIHDGHFREAIERTAGLNNCKIVKEDSVDFLLGLINLKKLKTVFWIDAHEFGFGWPLLKEIEIISQNWESAFVIIDDFFVPGKPWFEAYKYDGKTCSYEYIQDSLGGRSHQVWYPTYQPPVNWRTIGWGLLTLNTTYDPQLWMEQGC